MLDALGELERQSPGRYRLTWIGTGPNDPVTGEQLASSFEPQQIEKLSKESGVPATQVPDMLSRILPSLIDKLTPNGVLEEGSTLDQALDFVKAAGASRGSHLDPWQQYAQVLLMTDELMFVD